MRSKSGNTCGSVMENGSVGRGSTVLIDIMRYNVMFRALHSTVIAIAMNMNPPPPFSLSLSRPVGIYPTYLYVLDAFCYNR